MTSRTIIIELRVDYMDEEKHMLMKKVCGRAANKILSQAMLLQEKRPPQIAVHSNDYMHGTETIKAEDYENDE